MRMRHGLLVGLLIMMAACVESIPTEVSSRERVLLAVSGSVEGSDPYYIAEPYLQYGIYASLSVDYQTFGTNPESITDEEFDSVGASTINSSEEYYYQDDGITVEELITSGGGGGPGDGEQLESMGSEIGEVTQGESAETTTMGLAGYCEDQYAAIARRCRRIGSSRGRALCWAAAMVVYANCRRNAT